MCMEQSIRQGEDHSELVDDHNVPCAVCYASTRVAVTMIPAKTQMPFNMDSGVLWLPHVRLS